MVEITAALVKKLREVTGAGMMDCKRALQDNGGNIEKAADELRIKGQAKADKAAGRTAADGEIVIDVAEDGKSAVMVEVNSETDFVARDEGFKAFVQTVGATALALGIADIDQLPQAVIHDTSETIEHARQALISKVGENIQLRRMRRVEARGTLGYYIHAGRIGVIVDVLGDGMALAKDLAMHIAASRPLVVHRDDVPEEVIRREREIFTAQAQESGKPDEIIAKMIDGRIRKFLDEVSLVGQPFVKDPDIKIDALLKNEKAEVLSFVRFEVGEGIEKQSTDFVAEVMAQVNDSE